MGWFRTLKLFAVLSCRGKKDVPAQWCLCRGDQWSPLQGRQSLFRLLLLIFAFLLASCTQAAPRAPQIPADFTAAVEVVRGDLTYSADYTRRGNAETLHITAPVGDVTAAVPDDGIFAPFALFDAPDGCLTESLDDGGLTVYAGRCGGDTYSVAVDGAGVPVRLTGSVGGCAAEIRVLQFAQIPPSAGEEGNAHE